MFVMNTKCIHNMFTRVDVMNKRAMTCCFTGHRNIPKSMYSVVKFKLRREIEKLIKQGVLYFGAGGALGFDTIAALTVLDLKKKHPDIKLILVLPCVNQMKNWDRADVEAYNDIIERADKVVYTSKEYYEGCMLKRNRHLVENSAYCICYCKYQSGGTAYTVDYAKKQNVTVINIA